MGYGQVARKVEDHGQTLPKEIEFRPIPEIY